MARDRITIEQLDRLAVDPETGRLFWDNQEVVTVLSLPWYVNAAIVAGAAIAGLSLIWSVVRFFLERWWPAPKP